MNTIAKTYSDRDGISFLKNAFRHEQEVLINKVLLAKKSITHPSELGSVFEKLFIELFRKYFPKRYSINSGIIIDSNGKTSDQIDIVVYDNFYTPVYLGQNEFNYIPAEGVYAVFEVKPILNKKNLLYAAEKGESVRQLERTSIEYPIPGDKMAPPKNPINIQTGVITAEVEWKDGLGISFRKHMKSLAEKKQINCGLVLKGQFFDLYENKLNIGDQENSLIVFIFRLLKQLQLVGTVPAIDWNAYADIFNHPLKEKE